jgi:hypothetical protein
MITCCYNKLSLHLENLNSYYTYHNIFSKEWQLVATTSCHSIQKILILIIYTIRFSKCNDNLLKQVVIAFRKS